MLVSDLNCENGPLRRAFSSRRSSVPDLLRNRRARIGAAIPRLEDQWMVNGAEAATSYGVVVFLFNWTT